MRDLKATGPQAPPGAAVASTASRRVDFWSSTEYSTFLPALVDALHPTGWQARSRYAVSEGDYRHARGRLARMMVRTRAYALYPLKVAAAMRHGDPVDVAVVCTNTFYAPRVAEVASGPAPVVHWVFDLYPEVLTLAGKLRAGSFAARWTLDLVRQTFDAAAANVFLGDHLLRHAEASCGSIPRSHVIPVGADVRPFAGGVLRLAADAPVTVLYCGNMGRLHDVRTVERLLSAGGTPRAVRWSFRGNGAGFMQLERAVTGSGAIELGPNLDSAGWIAALRAAPVALVTLRQGAEGLAMPSKTYSAMAAGQAILAVCPERSDLADTVRGHDCGWVVEPGDVDGLRAALEEASVERDRLQARREASWQAARDHFSAEALAPRWALLLTDVLRRTRGDS